MSATATTAARPGALRHTAARLAAANLTLLVWFWACTVPVVVLARVLVDRWLDADDVSVVLYARHAAIWFPFSQVIGLVAPYLRMHVAAGMTRRTFARATVLVAVGTGAAYGVALTVLALGERGVHTALGRGWRVQDAGLADRLGDDEHVEGAHVAHGRTRAVGRVVVGDRGDRVGGRAARERQGGGDDQAGDGGPGGAGAEAGHEGSCWSRARARGRVGGLPVRPDRPATRTRGAAGQPTRAGARDLGPGVWRRARRAGAPRASPRTGRCWSGA